MGELRVKISQAVFHMLGVPKPAREALLRVGLSGLKIFLAADCKLLNRC